ncbi:putative pentatricopeptide repeat-containing protein At5g43820 [Camellia sinensis]|uniref:Pentacotripeptide-repeat region of PRORP domain-containing protein n=1 Tax=Camellia sinensis var. sinensis TaxID=542762 RepID=A0A4S4DUN5_CAMSN|nr:putative pentatricopeptide repeat-containing protein At5g43820 [Camellia sinensis]XP_028085738.1 putative pentatricopeptide repeat-containing protein At5g43820 [Camellia sinensis]XP_028085739.1 putative pentatricopeptide repeat-containing protein At5g43820 [Camellia sinensis]XP_028085741.1 putative pentatricopeptide repeat-containing protein At5g43820 [Camellia sinensis]XP_028085742.1 putative pentatricopeptide repeat-containing protein At5g43820 [Camellia sinensis]XP_028085743.1 putative p
MAAQTQRITAYLSRFYTFRYNSHFLSSSNSLSQFSFSTCDSLSNSSNNEPLENPPTFHTITHESHILNELSHLLPIPHNPSIQTQFANNQPEFRAVDGFLAPEDKLRGVFLQKLLGKSAIEHALSNTGVELSVHTVAKVVNRGNLGGEAMVMFFNWAIKQPMINKEIDSYHVILKALGRRKFFDFMVEILHDMKMEGITPVSDTLEIVMDSYVRARHVSKAIQFFGQLEEFGSKCDTESLNVLLLCLCRRSHVGLANSVLNKMKGKIPFNCMSYNLVICGWSKFGRISDIETVLRAMMEDGFDPDCLTFSYLLEGLGRADQIDDSVEIFKSMEERGCAPDAGVYNAMISNFISVGDFDESKRYYESMLSNNCKPNMDTYTTLITGFLKARKVADAIEMFDEMLSRGFIPMSGTVTSFIEPLCSYGPPHAALMIYKKARKVGCSVSLVAYKLLLMRLSRFGKCGMLLSIWDEMQKNGHSSDMEVYEYVISGLCNVGQLENAVLVMEESLRMGFCPSRLICSKLNNKLLSSYKVDMAYKLFLKIKAARCSENSRRLWRARGWHF